MKKQPLAIFGVQDESGKIALYPGVAALLEVLLMLLPAIPAYLWMWPNVQGTAQLFAQCLKWPMKIQSCYSCQFVLMKNRLRLLSRTKEKSLLKKVK